MQGVGEEGRTGAAANPVVRIFGPVARIGAIFAGWSLLGLSLLVGLEVILRKVFSMSLQGADELGGYAVAIVGAFGFAWTLLERAHIRIDLFTGRLPRPVRRVLDVAALGSLAVFAVFMAWRSATALADSIEFGSLSGTPLMTPLSWPQSVWVVGLVFFAVVASVAFLHALALLAVAPDRVDLWYGARSLSDELEEEKRSLKERGVAETVP